MNSTPQVLCAGVIVGDHLCAPIDHVPHPGEVVTSASMLLSLGGGAANTAVGLAKMGIRAAVAGCVGNDALGRLIVEMLRTARVDVEPVRVCPDTVTGQSLIVNVRGDDRRFITAFGANTQFGAADVDANLVKQVRVLYVGGYLVLPGLRHDALAATLAAARAAGVQTVLDIALSGPGDYLSQLAAVLPHVDVFLPNTDEARQITGESDPLRQAERFHQLGARAAIVTLGAKGSVLVSDKQRLRAGAFPVEIVDATGGGDAFDAGYIFGMVNGLGSEDCLRYAAALGASCVRAVGTTTSLFTRDECEAFLNRNSLQIEHL